MNRNRILFTVLLFFCAFHSNAQHKPELINSGQIITQVAKLYDAGSYQEAASLCHQIGRNDTNYNIAQYNEAYCFYNLGKYDTVIRMCKALIALENYTGFDAYNLLGNTYDAQKHRNEAIKVYKEALARFPRAYLLYFNLGVAYYQSQQMDEAFQSFKTALTLNPYHPGTHYFFGLINAEEKRWAPAMLAMHTCLLLGPNKTTESRCLNMILNIAKGDYIPDSGSHTFSLPEDPAFIKIDKLISSKMAFREEYEIETKLEDKLMKQTQLLLESVVQSKPKSDDYFVKLYVPFFTELVAQKYLKTFLYYPYHSLDNEIITKWKSKNKNEIQEFETWAGEYFVRQSTEYTDSVDGKPMAFKRYLYRNRYLQALGDYADVKKEVPKGYWKFFFDNTILSAQGLFDENGKKTGFWRGYYESGKLKTEAHYLAGKLDGAFKEYYMNGNTFITAKYKDGQYEGPVEEYFKNGASKSEEVYSAGIQIGHARYFYENGFIKTEADFKNGHAGGIVSRYSNSGYKTAEVNYKEGKQSGAITEYHSNGTTLSKGTMVNDLADGRFEYFDEHGQLIKEGEFLEGKMTGVWKEYYSNGKLSQELPYIKGKAQGTQSQYDEDGLKFYTAVFKDDKLTGYKYYDKAGKVIGEANETHGELDIKGHYPDGKVSVEGKMKKGLRDGKWNYYYKSGGVKTIETYNNGVQSGPYQTFHKNGKVNIESTYIDGVLSGPYRKFYQNGNLQSEEVVVNDKAEGDTYTYLSNGPLVSHSYYKTGDEYHWQSNYYPDGKLDYEYYMDLAHMSKYMVYDTTGHIASRYENPTGTSSCDIKYFNGVQKILASYDKGRTNGQFKEFYGNGQMETLRYYRHGIDDNTFVKHFDDGQNAVTGAFRYGKRDSIWTYFSDGKVESYGHLDKDNYTGNWTWLYANGKPERITKFIDDERDSVMVLYSPDGQVRIKIRYAAGAILGYTYPGKDGKDVPEITLNNETGKIEAYYQNGHKSYESTYKNGQRDGKNIYYYPDGGLQFVYNFIDGWREGKQLSYYPDGKIEKEENYLNDDQHGATLYFDKNGKPQKEENYYMGGRHGISRVYNADKVKEYNYYYGVLLSEK